MKEIDKRQGEDIKASIQEAARAAAAMESSATHSEVTLKVVRENGERQLRAYLRVDMQSLQETQKGGIVLRFVPTPGNSNPAIIVLFYVINSGQTPAYGVIDQININLFDNPIPEGLTFATKVTAINRGNCVINPGQGISIHATRRLQTNELTAFRSGKTVALITGAINFIDAFNIPRWVTFCFTGTCIPNGTVSVDVHNQGNDAN